MNQTVLWAITVTVFAVVAAAILIAYYRLDRHWQRRYGALKDWADEAQSDERNKVRTMRMGLASVLRPDHPRYQIEVVDWGEDFIGGHDTLPRYRWVVSDADQVLKRTLGEESDDTPNYLMLGNEPTRDQAWWRALAWVEQHEHTVVVVEGRAR